MTKIFFFLIGLIGMVFRFIYTIISEILFLIWDILNLIKIGIVKMFWGLVKFGRNILGMPYDPQKKIRRRKK